jgi:hypothetical protein
MIYKIFNEVIKFLLAPDWERLTFISPNLFFGIFIDYTVYSSFY